MRMSDGAADPSVSVLPDDIETVRVLFPDLHGLLRGKAVVARIWPDVLRAGLAVPGTLLLKDTSHRTAFSIWSGDGDAPQGAGDVLLRPDPATLRRLPWAPHSAWVLCDAIGRDGDPMPVAPRTILARAVDRLAERGLAATFGLEVEFHVYRRLGEGPTHGEATMPAAPVDTAPLTTGYQFLTDDEYAAAEPVLDRIRRAADALGLAVRSVEVEMGPSQFEVTFDPGPPMAQADALVMFRTAVKQVCAAQGLHASFMARPRLPNAAANGWHIHQSLSDAAGRNLFVPEGDALTDAASGWIAGLLAHAAATSLLTVPTVNGYKRYQPFQLAPERIAWGRDNRGAMLRVLCAPGDAASRIENRAPDSAANPYLAFAAQIHAGLDGLDRGLAAPPPTRTPYADDAPRLPRDLGEAIAAFDASEMLRGALGAEVVEHLLTIKRFEWRRYLDAVSEWEQAEYFTHF
jgi:glutamine synthetase